MTIRPEFQTELFEKGVATRREVLGDALVDRSLAGVTDLTATLQRMIAEWAWGDVWQRPGLSKQKRRNLNIVTPTPLHSLRTLTANLRRALPPGVDDAKIAELHMPK